MCYGVKRIYCLISTETYFVNVLQRSIDMTSLTETRQRSTPVALQGEDYEHLTLREKFAKLYRDNPPDFTVKKSVANRYGVAYFLMMFFLQCYRKKNSYNNGWSSSVLFRTTT